MIKEPADWTGKSQREIRGDFRCAQKGAGSSRAAPRLLLLAIVLNGRYPADAGWRPEAILPLGG
jgi:hypothetical protein